MYYFGRGTCKNRDCNSTNNILKDLKTKYFSGASHGLSLYNSAPHNCILGQNVAVIFSNKTRVINEKTDVW